MAFSVAESVRIGGFGLARRWRAIFGASLVVLVPVEFAYGLLDVDRGWRGGFDFPEVAAIAVGTIGPGLASVAASRAYRGEAAGEAIRWTVRRAPAVALLSVVTCGAVLLGLAILIIPGLIILTRWLLAWAVYADGDVSWRRALGRSNELVRGHSSRVFALAAGLVTLAVEAAILFAVYEQLRPSGETDG